MAKPTYVIGHRNPDTDSICSAIGYSHLKNAMGENTVPARAGKINAETKYVLDYFGVPAPQLINYLYPRVRDVMLEKTPTLQPHNTLRDLGQLMKEHNVKSVAVTDNNHSFLGIVTVGDLAKRYFDELELQDLSEAGVNFNAILHVLGGKVICGKNRLYENVSGKLRIAGASSHTFKQIVYAGDIVLVSDRVSIQKASIEKNVAGIILTNTAEPSQDVLEAAAERGIIIIQTHHDTYTCARLVNQSIPVSQVMRTNVVSFKPTDLIEDIKKVIISTNYRDYPVLENGKLVGIINRDQLIVPEKEKVILVDHNESSHAVEGIEEAIIVEIIDHHRLGGLQTGEPIFIRHEPVGCTATIVANMHWHRNVDIGSTIAGLLLSAIISDTILFKSPTSTAKDKETATKLAQIAGIEMQSFGMNLLKAGSSLSGISPSEIAQNDLKEFNIGEYQMAVAQISVLDPQEVLKQKEAVMSAMQSMGEKENYDLTLLMVTDIINEATYLVYVGQPDWLLRQAFRQDGDNGVIYLPGVMSRKKQVVPPLVEIARQNQ